jgi:4-amino-4-deoxy-L-arabinose transferase-like glycosyltransferase
MRYLKYDVFLILIILFVCIFLYSDRVPVDYMEPRNYIAAKEILENGSWLLPTMEGKLRIAKPPLPTWFTSVAMMCAGTDTNLIVNRIPAGISAALLALFTFLIAKRVSGSWWFATTSLLVLVTSYLFMLAARRNEWDIYAHMAMAAAIWALIEAFVRKEGKNLFFLLFSLFMTISFYSKGPVAFWAMLLPFFIGYCIAYGTSDLRIHKWGLLWACILCMLLSALWPAYVYWNAPHIATAVASQESDAWIHTSINPMWAYMIHMHEIVGIWLPLLLFGIAVPFIQKDKRPEEKLIAFWFILTVVSLSVIPEKRIRYILPAVVPGSMVASIAIIRLCEARGLAWKLVYGAFCILTGALFIVAAVALVKFSQGRPYSILGAILLGIVSIVLIYELLTKKTKNTHLVAIAGACLSVVFVLPMAYERLGPDDARLFMHVRENPELKQREFLTTPKDMREDTLTYDIRWALGKNITPISGDLYCSLTQQEGSDKYALITTKKLKMKSSVFRLVDTITTKRTTYYIYLMP